MHDLYTRVENLTLPITVLRCDYDKPSHTNYLFTIFHRLNSGGSKLNNQEIRNAIYSGSFNNLLKELNANPAWMKINKMKKTEGYRFTKEELILRLFAFHDKYHSYTGKLSKFLNDYMQDNRNIGVDVVDQKRKLFNRTVNIVYNKVFGGKVPSKLSITILEALLVGVSLNLDYLEDQTENILQSLFDKLQKEEEFSEEKLREGLAGRPRVINRLSAAQKMFSGAV